MVLVFDPGFRPDQRIECRIAVQRGGLQVRADALARREHVVEGGNDRRRCRLGHQPKDTYGLGPGGFPARRKSERQRIGSYRQWKLNLDSPEVNLSSKDPCKQDIDPDGGDLRGHLKTQIAILRNGEGCNYHGQKGRKPADREARQKGKDEAADRRDGEDGQSETIGALDEDGAGNSAD